MLLELVSYTNIEQNKLYMNYRNTANPLIESRVTGKLIIFDNIIFSQD